TSVIDDPDLVPSNLVIAPGEVFNDDNTVQIDARITNESTVGTGSGFDWRIDVAGNTVASGSESALAAGGFVDISASGLGPFTAGDNLVEVIADVNDAVTEKDETNNTVADSLFVQEPGFQIELIYVSSFTATQQTIIDAAATRWESIITGDLPSEFIEYFPPQPYCPESFEGNVDDLKVWVYTTDHSSGVGGVLAFAGPWFLRSSELAACGTMYFDINDLANLESDGRLGDVAGHELAHVLGIGTIWDDDPNLVSDPVDLLRGVGTTDPYFAGTQAIAQFDAAGGGSYADNKVPVEDEQGYGHWRESVLDTELMTPFAEPAGTTSEWSLITAGAFEDMGYQVNLSSAEIDSYTLSLPSVLAESRESGQPAFDDIVVQPRFIRLPDGRVIQLGR
ncbi:MAG: leishmanolysin-related zinc metalloendopeptidase, partial [Candidatus Longimicrobiales bacterium M2_2A_002]